MKKEKNKKEMHDENMLSKVKSMILDNKDKLIKGFIILAVVLGVGVFAYFTSDSYGQEVQTAEFVDITIDEYLNLMKSEDKKIVYVASPTCGYCVKQSPILKTIVSKYNLEVYYLNTSNFYDRELNDYTEDGYKFINSDEVYKEGYGTPNTIIVQDGRVVDGIYHYAESNDLINLFKENGFINE